MIMMTLAILVPLAFARDSRYYSSWDIDYQYPMGGSWESFYPLETPYFTNWIEYGNKFASTIDCEAGDYFIQSKLRCVDESMSEDDIYAYLKIYAGSEALNIGARIRFDFVDNVPTMTFKLQTLTGYQIGGSYSVNYNDWDVALQLKFNFGASDSTWDYGYHCAMYKVNRDSGQLVLLEESHCYGDSVISSKPTIYHYFFIYNGQVPWFRNWKVTSVIYDVGIRPDVKNEDCKCDMRDVNFACNMFGKDIEDTDWWDDAWRADAKCDGKIDMKDINYFTSKYGQSW